MTMAMTMTVYLRVRMLVLNNSDLLQIYIKIPPLPPFGKGGMGDFNAWLCLLQTWGLVGVKKVKIVGRQQKQNGHPVPPTEPSTTAPIGFIEDSLDI